MTDLLTQWREHRKQCNREDDSERLGDLMAKEIEALRGQVVDLRHEADLHRDTRDELVFGASEEDDQ